MKQIAEAAGVSAMTVSRVFSDSSIVSEATSQRIRKIAQELGFKSNRMARGMKSGRSSIIGFVMPAKHAIGSQIFQGAYDYFHKQDMIMSLDLVCANAGEVAFEEQSKLINRLLEIRVDGIILLPVNEETNLYYFNELIENNIPVVCVDRDINQFSSDFVGTDDEAGGIEAAEILSNNNCKRPILISTGEFASTSRLRIQGFLEGAKTHGLKVQEHIICPSFRYNTELIYEKLAANKGKFDSVFAVTDRMAASAWNSCKILDIKVPEEVKIIGFGNLDISDPRYQLSSFDQDPQKIGLNAAKLLSEKMHRLQASEKNDVAKIFLNSPRFVEGISCPLTAKE